MSEIDDLLQQFDLDETALARFQAIAAEHQGFKAFLDEVVVASLPAAEKIMDLGVDAGAAVVGAEAGPFAPIAAGAAKFFGSKIEAKILAYLKARFAQPPGP